MTTISNIPRNDYLVGFTKKENIAEQKRIYLGYVYDNKVHKIGFSVQKFGSKFFLKQTLYNINYEIIVCQIDFNYMEEQDIEFYKNLINGF